MAPRLEPENHRRIVVIGNAGGGKSTLARQIAASIGTSYVEIDRLLWQQNWEATDPQSYDSAHQRAISGDSWVIDGLGRRESIAPRLSRSTEIIVIDLPIWVHFWLAAERQIAWSKGPIDNPPGGVTAAPPTRLLFQTIWDVDQHWMPDLRRLVNEAETAGKPITRIATLEELGLMTRQYSM